MNQLGLFEPVRARRRDPETSQEAAGKVSRFAANHYNRIAAALRDGPGTYVEIADRCGLERHAVARRLPEMAHLGVHPTGIKRGGMREWGINQMSPRLPHHRQFPDFKRRRDDEIEEALIHTAIALLYVVGVLVLVYLAAFVAGTV